MQKQLFLVKEKKEGVTEKFAVPRHPEFVINEIISNTKWKARNTKTGDIVFVTKIVKGDFFEYEITS